MSFPDAAADSPTNPLTTEPRFFKTFDEALQQSDNNSYGMIFPTTSTDDFQYDPFLQI